MIRSDKYREIEKIHSNNGIVVYKAYDLELGLHVAYKTIDAMNVYSVAEELLEREYENLKVFDSKHIVPIVEFVRGENLALVTKYIHGELLSTLINKGQLTIKEKTKIAISIIQSLEIVHKHKMIHKDINPTNIIWDPINEVAVLLDFNLAERSHNAKIEFVQPKHLQGTLSYISPEQTGRMNRYLDYRSDFYSLGVTLYELFTLEKPFSQNDYLEIIHAHIAILPESPYEVNPNIPKAISNMIVKLIQKNADERYQTIGGILNDFIQYQKTENESMIVGQMDANNQLIISQQVYGREHEIEELHEIYSNVIRGDKKVVFVKGYSGIGKTTVIKELYKTITNSKGYFLTGKFDQFNRLTPYYALRSIIVDFINLLLQEDEKRIHAWSQQLSRELGDSASVLLNIIPELEILLGKHDIEFNSIQETHNRFKRSMQKLIASIASEAHPVVLFIDDIQWIDATSLNLLDEMIRNEELKYINIIGAYRENEIHSAHLLAAFLNGLNRDHIDVRFLKIAPIKHKDVKALLIDTFDDSIDYDPIIDSIMEKTNGNPFFIKQLIQTMYDEKCVVFDSLINQWYFDYKCLDNLKISSNVAELLTDKITNLSTLAQKVLSTAACIGNSFDFGSLKKITECSIDEVEMALLELREKSYIQSLSYRDYVFSHDQIHQAAYNLVEDLFDTHYKIAEKLNHESNQTIELTLKTANHLSQCLKLKSSFAFDHMEDILLKAGDIAFRNIAYDEAMVYYRHVENLQVSTWEQDYKNQLYLKNQMIQTAYLLGDYNTLDQLSVELKKYVISPLHLADMYDVNIHAFMSRTMHEEGLETALEALNAFGMDITLDVDPKDYEIAMGNLFGAIGDRSIDSLLELPVMTDESQISIMKMLTGLIPLLFNTAPQLLLLVIIEMINISLKHGNCKYSSFGYGFFGTIISGLGMVNQAVLYGNLSLDLIEKLDATTEIPKNYMVSGQHIMFLEHHLSTCIDLLEQGYYKGVELGDHVYAGFSGHGYCNMSFLAGRSLNKTLKAFEIYSASFLDINQGTQLLFQEIYQETIRNLIYDTEQPSMLLGNHFNEEIQLQEIINRNHRTALFVFYFNKMYLAFIYNDYEKALEYVDKFLEYLDGGTGLIHGLIYYQYAALIRLKLYDSMNEEERQKARLIIDECLNNLEPLKNRLNFKHRYLIIKAEVSRIDKAYDEARNLYEQALTEVVQARYTNEEAVYRELIADYYLEVSNAEMYHYYRNTAYLAYSKWGAKAKAGLLASDSSNLSHFKLTQSIYTVHTSGSEYKDFGHIDLHSILKFSQIVAKEINLEELLKKTLYILIENAGATKGTIVSLNKNNQWTIAKQDNKLDFNIERVDVLDKFDELPHKVLNYVYNSRKIVRLDYALEDDLFKHDDYIHRHQIQSLLCYPLLNQGDILGMVFLENTIATEVFSSERTEFLTLLSTQIAISIENAAIYSYLESIVEKRTTDLKLKNTELIRLNERLNFISITDGLTGLNNRRKVDEVLEYEYQKYIRYKEAFSVILVDIDRFKLVNDVHGHLIGDLVLKNIAEELKHITRSVDVVGRWGGEEFLIICPNTKKANACDVAEKVRAAIEKMALSEVGLVTCSLGVSMIESNQEIKDVIRVADENLYKSKMTGRNKVTC